MNNIQLSLEPLALLCVLISSFTAIYIMKRETLLPIYKERHDKLISPVFHAIEPFLYSDVIPNNFNAILDIIENNLNLADAYLLNVYYECRCNTSSKTYKKFCKCIDKEFDISCRNIHLKCRSWYYRRNHHQYTFKLNFHAYFLIKDALIIAQYLSMVSIAITCILYILSYIEIVSMFNTILKMTILFLLLIWIRWFLYKI